MTAPARTQNQLAATPLVVSEKLLDSIIEQTIATQSAHKRLAPFLTVGQSYDRIAAQLREAMIKVPKLAECDPNTIIDAVVTIQRWRLEIGETAYLVPFGDRANSRQVCTAVRGYIGDIELLISNGIARRVDAFCVYENEPFTYREGTSPILEHQPLAPSQRGAMIGAYAILWQTFTNAKAAFLYMEEIEAIREKYSRQWNRKTVGDCPPWYSKKCAVKAVTKLLPKSPKVAKLREQMEEDEIVVASVRRGIDAPRPAHITADGEDRSESDGGGGIDRSTTVTSSASTETSETPEPTDSSPECPKCSGPMWDNRASKTNPKQPDFKCKDRTSCDGVIWPPRANGGAKKDVETGAPPADQPSLDITTPARPPSAQSQGR